MNVLHFSAVKNWGGGGNHVENLCYELSRIHPQVNNYIVVGKGGQFHQRLKKSNFSYETVTLATNFDPRAIFKLIKLCNKYQIDLIHIHGPTSLTLAVMADMFRSLPPFVFSKKTSFPIRKRKLTLFKYNHPKIKTILCVSKATQKIAEEAIVDKKKLRTIYHGTRIDNKSTDTPFKLREKLPISSREVIIGNIANHIEAKDLETWVDTIFTLITKHGLKNTRFVQIGAYTKYTKSIKEKVKSMGLQDHIYFMGFLPNASNFISQFDLFLLTSKIEGIPQVIYEAFFHKTPIVSTNVGGIPEIITHNYNGLLAEKGNSQTLAKHVKKLLEDPSLYSLFKKRSHERLLPKYTAENMAIETFKEYQYILKHFEG